MEPLATADDVAARLGRDLTPAEEERIDALLTDASANVRRISTQQFTAGLSTVTLPLRNSRARLPQRPVLEIASVEDVNGNTLTAWLLVGDQLRLSAVPINAFEIEPYRCGLSEIVVEYSHGYEPTTDDPPVSTIPDQIIAVVCSVVARALGTQPDQTGVIQESIGGYSYATGSAAAQGGLGMLASEREVCESFRRPRSPISTLT